jgi:predicted ATPase
MLNQIAIKNYKCFEDFSFSFDADTHAMLLLGNNGSGKTSFADALELFQKIGRGEGRIGRLIAPEQRWDTTCPVELKVTVTLEENRYEYGFSLEFPDGYQELRISSEKLTCGGHVVYDRKSANIFFAQEKTTQSFTYDWHVLFLPTFANNNDTLQDRVALFRAWLANILVLSPYPKMFKEEFGSSVHWPSRDCTDCASWLSHLLTSRPKSYSEIENYLKEIWYDFHTISNEQVGSLNKQLKLEFQEDAFKHKTSYSPTLNLLSDGEKCLFLSAVVIAAHAVTPSTLCFWDEPDAFLSLSETAHFIRKMRNVFSEHGQLLVTSHNQEVINAFTESTTWIIDRKSHLSPVKPLKRISDVRGSDILPKKSSLIHALTAGEIRS